MTRDYGCVIEPHVPCRQVVLRHRAAKQPGRRAATNRGFAHADERTGAAQRSGQRGMQSWSSPFLLSAALARGLAGGNPREHHHEDLRRRPRHDDGEWNPSLLDSRKPGQITSVCSLSAPYSVRRQAPGAVPRP
jgi:hypothetical protein